jgi:hypothetical protein
LVVGGDLVVCCETTLNGRELGRERSMGTWSGRRGPRKAVGYHKWQDGEDSDWDWNGLASSRMSLLIPEYRVLLHLTGVPTCNASRTSSCLPETGNGFQDLELEWSCLVCVCQSRSTPSESLLVMCLARGRLFQRVMGAMPSIENFLHLAPKILDRTFEVAARIQAVLIKGRASLLF